MQLIYEFLQQLGVASLDSFWFPMLIWTVIALFIFLGFRAFRSLNPLYHYHLRVATLAAIPFGLLATFGAQYLSTLSLTAGSFDPAVFVVETPRTFYLSDPVMAAEFSPDWWEPNFLLGLVTTFILIVSAVMLIRLAMSYLSLRRLHTSLKKMNLTDLSAFEGSDFSQVKLSFHEHPLVPFTFGWKSPIIVLPKSIQDDPEKIRMAIQHELVHIKRGDYLLQLFLSVIESLLWFHPLIQWGAREIETYREISCDQEVLNTSGISLKKYASMLYELLPLNRGLGSFSVSMAVQQSTLKKRIQTMKYHKMYKTSVRRSLFFLGIMILGVTLPIACSDLRGPQAMDERELESTSLVISDPLLTINGKEIADWNGKTQKSSGLDGLFYRTKDHGVFLISPVQFSDAKMAGTISGDRIEFTINEMNVLVKSNTPISESEINIFAKHVIHDDDKPAMHALGTLPSRMLQSENLDILLEPVLPPPPPKPALNGNKDYFVVVEQMPRLIGGMAAVQSRVKYPELAKRAGIEGKVTVQFIVNENGDVENPQILRGIGGGCDEAALAAIREAKFEPGIQRGRPVKVQYTMPVVFRLNDSDFTTKENLEDLPPPPPLPSDN